MYKLSHKKKKKKSIKTDTKISDTSIIHAIISIHCIVEDFNIKSYVYSYFTPVCMFTETVRDPEDYTLPVHHAHMVPTRSTSSLRYYNVQRSDTSSSLTERRS